MSVEIFDDRGGFVSGGYKAVEAPQCEANVTGNQPTYRKRMPSQCMRVSQYRIDGKCYCAFHAGQVALVRLLSSEKAAVASVPETGGHYDP